MICSGVLEYLESLDTLDGDGQKAKAVDDEFFDEIDGEVIAPTPERKAPRGKGRGGNFMALDHDVWSAFGRWKL